LKRGVPKGQYNDSQQNEKGDFERSGKRASAEEPEDGVRG